MTRDVSEDEVRTILLGHIQKCFEIESEETHTDGSIHVKTTTGAKDSFLQNTRTNLDISITKNNEILRVIISGTARSAFSLMFGYSLIFIAMMVFGFMQSMGTADTPIHMILFLIFGTFIFFDLDRKINEPQGYLEKILVSLDTELG